MKTGIRNFAMLPLALVFAATVGAASPPTSHSTSKKARVSPSSSMLVSSLAAPNLGAAGSFAVLAASTVTNTGASAINGDLGLSPGISVTGFPPGMLAGTQYIADPASAQAQLDLTVAYNDAAARTVGAITLAGNLGGMTLAPGLYKSTSSLEISSGDLTLDAKGDASAVYIFQMGSTLVTTVGRKVILAGGAQAANIYWQVGSSATLGTSSVFKGNILAMASITATTGASVEGRLLARTAAVTLDNNVVNVTAASVSPVAVVGAPGACQDVTTLVAGGSSGNICSSAAFTSGANSTVNGWVTAKAATTLGATSRVHGNVTAGAAYTSGDGSVVDGNVSASGDVTLGANSRILGTVHSGTGVVTYGAGATVGGVSATAASVSPVAVVWAAGVCQNVTTLVAGGSSGNICSSAAFTSGANSTVNGSVTAKAATTLGATSRVHGDVTAGAAYTS